MRDSISTECEFTLDDYSGNGYFLSTKHPVLPNERIVCDTPTVIGELDKVTAGFVIFIQNGELALECHSWGESDIPKYFREADVQVRKVQIVSGNFLPIEEQS